MGRKSRSPRRRGGKPVPCGCPECVKNRESRVNLPNMATGGPIMKGGQVIGTVLPQASKVGPIIPIPIDPPVRKQKYSRVWEYRCG